MRDEKRSLLFLISHLFPLISHNSSLISIRSSLKKMDFTLSTYRKLIDTLQQQGFSFLPVEEFVSNPANKVIVLRHDVDSLPRNSLQFARIQADKGIRGVYYFRIVSQSYNEQIIKEIY